MNVFDFELNTCMKWNGLMKTSTHHIGIVYRYVFNVMFPSVCLNLHRPSSYHFECICILYVVVLVRICFFPFRFVYMQRDDLHFILSVVISSLPSIRCMSFDTCSNNTKFDLRIFIFGYSPFEEQCYEI